MTNDEAFRAICQHRLEVVFNDDLGTVCISFMPPNPTLTGWPLFAVERIKDGDVEAALRAVVERVVKEIDR